VSRDATEGEDSESLSIGALSQRTGCPIETIRYYERIGLLAGPPRTAGGQRAYGASHVARLTFVRRARDLGFSLVRVRELLALADGGTSGDVRAIAIAHLEETRQKIDELQRIAYQLNTLVRASTEAGTAAPIIAALRDPETPPE
jgi:DNA-binding transcriptional MerR regulator